MGEPVNHVTGLIKGRGQSIVNIITIIYTILILEFY